MRLLIVIALAAAAFSAAPRVARAQDAKPDTEQGGKQDAPKADLTGAWHFVLDTPGGDRESDADFHVDGDKVTGKYGKSDVAGSYADGKLDLAFNVDTEEAGSGTLKIKGTLEGDSISGNWEFTEYSGTFKAMRRTASAAAPAQ